MAKAKKKKAPKKAKVVKSKKKAVVRARMNDDIL